MTVTLERTYVDSTGSQDLVRDGTDVDNTPGTLQIIIFANRTNVVTGATGWTEISDSSGGGDGDWQPVLENQDYNTNSSARRGVAARWRIVPADAGDFTINLDSEGIAYVIYEFSTDATGGSWVLKTDPWTEPTYGTEFTDIVDQGTLTSAAADDPGTDGVSIFAAVHRHGDPGTETDLTFSNGYTQGGSYGQAGNMNGLSLVTAHKIGGGGSTDYGSWTWSSGSTIVLSVGYETSGGSTPVDLAGTGAVTFGSSGALEVTKSTAGTGAVVFGGSATVTPTRALAGTGAVVFGGTAEVTIAHGTYLTVGGDTVGLGVSGPTLQELVGTGAVVFGGTAELTPTKNVAGTGAVAFGGTAELTLTKNVAGTGAVVFTGTAELDTGDPTVALVGTGSVVFGASGTLEVTKSVAGSGAVVFGGSAVAAITRNVVGTGAVVFGATATLTVDTTKDLVGSGAVVFGSSGSLDVTRNLGGLGAVVFGATAEMAVTRGLAGSGDIVFTGTATVGGLVALAATGAVAFAGMGELAAGAASPSSGTKLGGQRVRQWRNPERVTDPQSRRIFQSITTELSRTERVAVMGMSAGLSIANGATTIVGDTAEWDEYGMIDASAGSITLPWDGWWEFTARLHVPHHPSGRGVFRLVWLGVDVLANDGHLLAAVPSGNNKTYKVDSMYEMPKGSVLVVDMYQNGGGNLTVGGPTPREFQFRAKYLGYSPNS